MQVLVLSARCTLDHHNFLVASDSKDRAARSGNETRKTWAIPSSLRPAPSDTSAPIDHGSRVRIFWPRRACDGPIIRLWRGASAASNVLSESAIGARQAGYETAPY